MAIRLSYDEDSLWQALVTALRAHGIDVHTALKAAMITRADEAHLLFATAQGRVQCSVNAGGALNSIRATWRNTHCISVWSSLGSSNMP